jgi:hypothetical protein
LSRGQNLENQAIFEHFEGHALCDWVRYIAGLITAGRRECWGSQTGEKAERHHIVVPFCFVPSA